MQCSCAEGLHFSAFHFKCISESSFLSHTHEPPVVMYGEGKMERGEERGKGGREETRKRKREKREEKYIHRHGGKRVMA